MANTMDLAVFDDLLREIAGDMLDGLRRRAQSARAIDAVLRGEADVVAADLGGGTGFVGCDRQPGDEVAYMNGVPVLVRMRCRG